MSGDHAEKEERKPAPIREFLERVGSHLYVGNLDYKTSEEEVKKFLGEVHAPSRVLMVTRFNRPAGYAFVSYDKDTDAQKIIEKLNGKELNDRKVKVQTAELKTEEELAVRREGRRGRGRGRGSRRGRPVVRAQSTSRTRSTSQKNESSPAKKEERSQSHDAGSPRGRRGRGRGGRGRGRAPRRSSENAEISKDTVYIGNLPREVTEEQLVSIFKDFNVKSARIPMRFGKSKGYGFLTLETEADVDKMLDDLTEVVIEERTLVFKRARAIPERETQE
jgi:RNA recognition motif-containing protein